MSSILRIVAASFLLAILATVIRAQEEPISPASWRTQVSNSEPTAKAGRWSKGTNPTVVDVDVAAAAEAKRKSVEIVALQNALNSDSRIARVTAAKALHAYVINGWVAPAARQLSDEHLALLARDLWPPIKDGVRKSALAEKTNEAPLDSALVIVSGYLAAMCSVPLSESVVRAVLWTPELDTVRSIQTTRRLPARQALESPLFMEDADVPDADSCINIRRASS